MGTWQESLGTPGTCLWRTLPPPNPLSNDVQQLPSNTINFIQFISLRRPKGSQIAQGMLLASGNFVYVWALDEGDHAKNGVKLMEFYSKLKAALAK
jgi:hypothetical protein